MMMASRPIAAAALCLAALVSTARADEIRGLSGTTTDEPVQSIEAEGQGKRLILKTDKRTVPLENVKSIRFDDRPAPEGGAVKVVLVTRDWLRGTIQGGTPAGFKLSTGSLGVVEVDLGQVLGMLFDAPPEKERDLESKRLATPPANDTVYLKAGGKAEGTIESIDGTNVVLDCPKPIGKISIPIAKAEALATAPAGQTKVPEGTGLEVRLRLACGSLLQGELKSLQGGTVTIKHKLLGEKKIKQKDVLELSVVNGAFVYVSDLDPKRQVEKFPPEFDRPADIWGWKRDKSVLGGRLRVGGRTYEKGLGVHSYCELEFELGGAYSEFRAVVGLDDSVRHLGQPGIGGVVFRVLVDGKPAKEVGDGGLKRSKTDAPKEIAVDVAGAKTLTLIADYQFMHVLGRADWADAFLVKKR